MGDLFDYLIDNMFTIFPCLVALGIACYYLFKQKKKLLLVAFLVPFAFALLLFPFDDLSDKIINLVASQSRSQVFLQFDSLGLSPFPPSLQMDNVTVETTMFNPLKASRLNLAPTLVGGFTATAKDMLSGDLKMNYRSGKKTEQAQLHKVSLEYNHVDLKKLSELLAVRGGLSGSAELDIDTEFDQNFGVQPQAEGEISVKEFSAKSLVVAGFVTLPDIKASEFKATFLLKDGKLRLNEIVIGGKPGDSINGRITGEIDLRLQREGANNVRAYPGQYSFNIELTLDKSISKSFDSMFELLQLNQYKSITSGGSRYAFNASAPNPSVIPPRFAPISK